MLGYTGEKNRKAGDDMATETKYPCKPATVAELEEKFNEYDSSLIEFLHPVTVQELDWGKVYHLLIWANLSSMH